MKNSCNNNKKKIKWIPIFIVVTVHLKRNMYKQKVCELNLCLLWQNCVSYVYQSCLSCHLGSSVLNIIPGEYFRLIVWVVYILWVVHNLVGQYKKVRQKMKNRSDKGHVILFECKSNAKLSTFQAKIEWNIFQYKKSLAPTKCTPVIFTKIRQHFVKSVHKCLLWE